jgi:hypothetical protein
MKSPPYSGLLVDRNQNKGAQAELGMLITAPTLELGNEEPTGRPISDP